MKKAILYLAIILLVGSCASPIAPTGGKKDTTPPKLTLSVPKSQSLNFKGKQIQLEFNEYITVENINQQLLITPEIEGTYQSKILPKGIILTFDKPFKENITYTFNFRNAFKDASERNPAKNIKVVFSTGNQIDSLRVEGLVKNLQNNKPQEGILVGLYVDTDTLKLNKHKPYYFTKSDSSGEYKLENLKAGRYRIVAFNDLNNNLKYDKAEWIDYEEKAIEVKEKLLKYNFKLFQVEDTLQKVMNTRSSVNYFYQVFKKGVKDIKVKFEKDSLPYMMDSDKQLKIINTLQTTDTLRTTITVLDSIGTKFEYSQKIKFKTSTKKTEITKELFTGITEPERIEELENTFNYLLKFNKPVFKIHLDRIKILEDTLKNIPITEKDISWNDTKTRLKISKELKAKQVIRVSVGKNAMFSVEGDTLKSFQTDYPLINIENYGTISGKVISNIPVIVQLIEKDAIKVLAETQSPIYIFDKIKPGTYYIRIIEDLNKNGRWDFGQPYLFKKAESIYFYETPIVLKANFEIALDPVNINTK